MKKMAVKTKTAVEFKYIKLYSSQENAQVAEGLNGYFH